MLWQVETVAQFGVVFLLFALGLEFSMTKVSICCLLTVNVVDFYNLSWIIYCLFLCFDAAAENCWPSCCPWRTFPNRITHVFVWCNCIGMCKNNHVYITYLERLFIIDLYDICSYVEHVCQRVFLLVLFYLCHLLQWYLSFSFLEFYSKAYLFLSCCFFIYMSIWSGGKVSGGTE